MKPDLKWVVTRINGKISSVALDFRPLERMLGKFINALPVGRTDEIVAVKMTTPELFELGGILRWEDLNLYGTPFQLHVWEELFKLSHTPGMQPRLMSYSELATLCGNRPGIRAVAHAVSLNPLAAIIPCHRIVPKAAIDLIHEIEELSHETLFQGRDLYPYHAVDFGEYAWGRDMKKDLIEADMEAVRKAELDIC